MQPERARGWIETILPVLREGGPVVSLVLLVIGGITVWWLVGTLDRQQNNTHILFDKLLICLDKQTEIVRDCNRKD